MYCRTLRCLCLGTSTAGRPVGASLPFNDGLCRCVVVVVVVVVVSQVSAKRSNIKGYSNDYDAGYGGKGGKGWGRGGKGGGRGAKGGKGGTGKGKGKGGYTWGGEWEGGGADFNAAPLQMEEPPASSYQGGAGNAVAGGGTLALSTGLSTARDGNGGARGSAILDRYSASSTATNNGAADVVVRKRGAPNEPERKSAVARLGPPAGLPTKSAVARLGPPPPAPPTRGAVARLGPPPAGPPPKGAIARLGPPPGLGAGAAAVKPAKQANLTAATAGSGMRKLASTQPAQKTAVLASTSSKATTSKASGASGASGNDRGNGEAVVLTFAEIMARKRAAAAAAEGNTGADAPPAAKRGRRAPAPTPPAAPEVGGGAAAVEAAAEQEAVEVAVAEGEAEDSDELPSYEEAEAVVAEFNVGQKVLGCFDANDEWYVEKMPGTWACSLVHHVFVLLWRLPAPYLSCTRPTPRRYPGTIAVCNDDGTYDVAYDDGDSETNKHPSRIQAAG